jgi:Glyoxalase-like domain
MVDVAAPGNSLVPSHPERASSCPYQGARYPELDGAAAGIMPVNHPAPARSLQGDLVSDSIKFGGVTLDCPNAGELAAFYAEITSGEVTVPGDSWAMMTCPDGSDICFQAAPGYSPPSWPDPASSMQMHLDFDVDDLDSTEARVLAAGATKYDVQPNDHSRVYADPVGHPFCLSTMATTDLRQS